MKNIFIGVVALVIIIGGYFIFNTNTEEMSEVRGAALLENTATIFRYQIGDTFTDYGFMTYTFAVDADGDYRAQGFIDINADGVFTEDEWVIKNNVVRVVAATPSRLGFDLSGRVSLEETTSVGVKLALTKEAVSDVGAITEADAFVSVAPIESYELVSEFGMDVPGASEELKRGAWATIAYAQQDFEETGVNDTSLPDLQGGPMDCFAIATANNLINMATQHGKRDELPEDPQELVAELKNAMQWNNGILNPNFLTGKADYIAALELPITTEEIKNPTIDDLAYAYSTGDAVEVSTTMVQSKSGKAGTGHVFTGVSAYQDGEFAGIAVKDPGTPNGTDIMDISMVAGNRGNEFLVMKYPLWDGIVIVDAIYIQRWNEPETENTEKSSTALEEEKTENTVGTGEPIDFKGVEIEGSFAHVKPGEYSEVYAVATGLTPGDEIEARLYGAQHTGTPQVVEADGNGVAHFTFRINQYAEYEVTVQNNDATLTKKVTVVVN